MKEHSIYDPANLPPVRKYQRFSPRPLWSKTGIPRSSAALAPRP